MTRTEVLEKADGCVTGKRAENYGEPEDNFNRIAKMWNAILGTDLVDAHKVALMMAALKIARGCTGQVVMDNYVDGAGYFACAGEIATRGVEKSHGKNPQL